MASKVGAPESDLKMRFGVVQLTAHGTQTPFKTSSGSSTSTARNTVGSRISPNTMVTATLATCVSVQTHRMGVTSTGTPNKKGTSGMPNTESRNTPTWSNTRTVTSLSVGVCAGNCTNISTAYVAGSSGPLTVRATCRPFSCNWHWATSNPCTSILPQSVMKVEGMSMFTDQDVPKVLARPPHWTSMVVSALENMGTATSAVSGTTSAGEEKSDQVTIDPSSRKLSKSHSPIDPSWGAVIGKITL
mmetsp:Transcript_68573/g.157418  ORF Transcript_68573/g.157418 Transcript_68573/m.157418 type:complete len:245 (+) Transcript_68573:501-1235(+)